jgi:hypothetical protein
MSPEQLQALRSQCFEWSPENPTIQTGQLCLAGGKPARFGNWGKNNLTFTAYINGGEKAELPWTKLNRFLKDDDLIKYFPAP